MSSEQLPNPPAEQPADPPAPTRARTPTPQNEWLELARPKLPERLARYKLTSFLGKTAIVSAVAAPVIELGNRLDAWDIPVAPAVGISLTAGVLYGLARLGRRANHQGRIGGKPRTEEELDKEALDHHSGGAKKMVLERPDLEHSAAVNYGFNTWSKWSRQTGDDPMSEDERKKRGLGDRPDLLLRQQAATVEGERQRLIIEQQRLAPPARGVVSMGRLEQIRTALGTPEASTPPLAPPSAPPAPGRHRA